MEFTGGKSWFPSETFVINSPKFIIDRIFLNFKTQLAAFHKI